jgi:hypothetical protein
VLAIGTEADSYFHSIGVYDFSNHDSYVRGPDKTRLGWDRPWASRASARQLAEQFKLEEK